MWAIKNIFYSDIWSDNDNLLGLVWKYHKIGRHSDHVHWLGFGFWCGWTWSVIHVGIIFTIICESVHRQKCLMSKIGDIQTVRPIYIWSDFTGTRSIEDSKSREKIANIMEMINLLSQITENYCLGHFFLFSSRAIGNEVMHDLTRYAPLRILNLEKQIA
jgi:hypothetical protein